jgi:hypothetical protein
MNVTPKLERWFHASPDDHAWAFAKRQAKSTNNATSGGPAEHPAAPCPKTGRMEIAAHKTGIN